MPRLTERTPKYRKHKASGQAIVTINGRDHYLGPWNTKASRLEYDRVIMEWLAKGRRPVQVGSDLTVIEVIERYCSHAQLYYRHPDGTQTNETACIKTALAVVRHLYGRTPVCEFGPLALEACRQAMVAKQWGRRSINNHVGRIKRMVKWAVAKELVPASIHHALTAVDGLRVGRTEARETAPVKPVADAVVEATLPHLSSVVAAMTQIQRLTGARPGEICMMRTADIDTSATTWTYRPMHHKTAHHGHQRAIYIGPKGQEVLRPFLKPLNAQAFIFSPRDAEAERREEMHIARKTPLYYGNRPGTNRRCRPKHEPGDVYDVAAYRRAITRGADRADIWAKAGKVIANDQRIVPHWHPHQLRHTAATEVRRQFGIEAAQHVLGHAGLNVTELYAEKDAAVAQRIAAAMG